MSFRRNKGFTGFILLVFLFTFIVMQWSTCNNLKLTWGKLKVGDKIYADSSKLHQKTNLYSPIWLWRRIRPFNADDIKQMDIPEWQKLKFISQLDTSIFQLSEMIRSETNIGQDSMFKYKTTCLGTYLKSDSISAIYYADGSGHEDYWYAITINKTVASIDDANEIKLPNNRTYADDYFYIDAHEARLEEAPLFKRVRSMQPILTEKDTVKSIKKRTSKLKSSHLAIS